MSTPLSSAVDAYRQAVESGDEARIAKVFASVGNERIDEFLEQLERAGLDVPDVVIDGAALQDRLAGKGVHLDVGEQVSMITEGSLPKLVRVRARALGIGADTLIDRADDAGLLEDAADVALAHAFIQAVLDGEEPQVTPDQGTILALARMLDVDHSILTSIIDRG